MKKAHIGLGLVAIVLLLGFTATASFAEAVETPALQQLETETSPQAVPAAEPVVETVVEAVVAPTPSDMPACDATTLPAAEPAPGMAAPDMAAPETVDMAVFNTRSACSNCGQCNCNGDDECSAICGYPANCERVMCPCATCRGKCEC